jgi:hypothetical protein
MFELLETHGSPNATLEVASGIPAAMLPGRYLGTIVAGR